MEKSNSPISPREATSLWQAAVASLNRAIPPDGYHSRLGPSSFAVDSDCGELSLTLLDGFRIQRVGEEVRDAPLWPYAAPEQTALAEGVVGVASNVYSLGLLGHYIFTGTHPFLGFRGLELAEAIVRSSPPPVSREDLSREQRALLGRILDRALAKEGARRYPNLGEMQGEIAVLLRSFEESGGAAGLVGRQSEQDRLRKLITGTRRGSAAFCLLTGEPGQGKSYLWRGIAECERREGEAWCYYKSPQTGGYPYAGVASLLRQLAQWRSAEGTGSPAQDLSSSLRGVLRTISPELEVLLTGGTEAAGSQSEDTGLVDETEVELARLFVALSGAFEAAVLALDDIQWLDDQSLAVMIRLANLGAIGMAVIFIGRPEAAERLPRELRREQFALDGLPEEEGQELLRGSLPDPPSQETLQRLYRRLNRYARGNPLAIMQLSRSFRDSESAEAALLESLRNVGAGDLVAALARSRFEQLSRGARRFLRLLSLLLPPVPFSILRSVPEVEEVGLQGLLEECESSLLIIANPRDEEAWFSHDSIETTAREEALGLPALVSQAVRLLFDASQEGRERALFALARLLTGATAEESLLSESDRGAAGQYLSRMETVGILAQAAARSLETMAPREALTFSERALSLIPGKGEDGLVQRLHMIAHEASFRLDDGASMSRHFARIYGTRDTLLINQARQLWISKAYSESSFRGAMRIGWKVLEDLGSLPPWKERETAFRAADRFVSRIRPRRIRQELLKQPFSSDPAVALRIRTAARLVPPMLTVEHTQLGVIVQIIVNESLRNGRTGYTGIAFVAWILLLASRKGAGSQMGTLVEAAKKLAEGSDDLVARHATNTYARIFSLVWVDQYDKGMEELLSFYREGNELGSFQFASHAAHLHCQALLYHGAPLTRVYEAIGHAREEMLQYNHYRTAKALAKYQQGVECLLGGTSDPLLLTGSVIEEVPYFRDLERREDHLSISGFYMIKAFLASYEQRSDLALSYCRKLGDYQATVASLHDNAVGSFLWGVAAFREGAWREAEDALRKVGRWARGEPANHRHRFLLLKAEAARARGRPRRASRLYEAARRLAIQNDYPHEAALIAESHGDLLSDDHRALDKSRELFHLTQSLYSHWGAHHAADRVRKKLGWVAGETRTSPAVLEESFVRRLAEASSVSEMIGVAVRDLSRYSGAERAFLTLRRGRLEEHFLLDRRLGEASEVATADPGKLAPALRGVLEGSEPAVGAGTEAVELDGRRYRFMLGRSAPSPELSLGLLLLTRPDGAGFSGAVRARIAAGVTLTGALLQLRATLLKSRRQEEDLQSARAEVAKAHDYSRTLFGSLTDALLLLDEEGRILSYNPATTPYLIFGSEDTVSLDGRIRYSVRELYREGEGSDVRRSEISWNQSDLRVSVTPAAAPEDPRRRILAATIEDITELKRQERALRRRDQELILADRMSSIGMLSATIAHEVSNPNHILQLNAQSLLMILRQIRSGGSVDDMDALSEAEEVAEQILQGSQRIESVVDGIKEYGRGGRQEEWQTTTPEEVCQRAFRFSRIMAAQYTNHLRLEAGDSLPRIRVLGGLLEQAIVNLIKNSCEALLDGSGRVCLASAYDEESEEVVISVADDGGGMDPRRQSRLGRPFESGRAEDGGTGLGLSIVRAILDRHDGRLLFREDDDYMTVAEVRLPPLRDSD